MSPWLVAVNRGLMGHWREWTLVLIGWESWRLPSGLSEAQRWQSQVSL